MLVMLLSLAGCESFGKAMTVKNPVVPAPPRRVANLLPSSSEEVGRAYVDDLVLSDPLPSAGDIKQVSAGSEPETEPPVERLPGAEVAALVNGQPIFVDEVLSPFAFGIFQQEKRIEKMPPGPMRTAEQRQFRRQRQALVKQYIKPHIERQLLLQALKAKLKDDQLKGMEKHMDGLFEEEAKKMMDHFQVSTPAELDVALGKTGSSLDSQRTSFKNQRISMQYFSMKAPKSTFERLDLLEYYQSHLQDYAYPGQVKWQQIVLPFVDHDGKEKTRKLAKRILAKLNDGTDFGAMAIKYSAGVTAKAGGVHDWTKAGSFANSDVEASLFEIREGEVSRPIEGPTGIQIVRLIQRKVAGHRSFESVQTEIKDALREAEFRKAHESILKDLYQKASIEMMFEAAKPDAEQAAF